jgi:hypothetical protein
MIKIILNYFYVSSLVFALVPKSEGSIINCDSIFENPSFRITQQNGTNPYDIIYKILTSDASLPAVLSGRTEYESTEFVQQHLIPKLSVESPNSRFLYADLNDLKLGENKPFLTLLKKISIQEISSWSGKFGQEMISRLIKEILNTKSSGALLITFSQLLDIYTTSLKTHPDQFIQRPSIYIFFDHVKFENAKFKHQFFDIFFNLLDLLERSRSNEVDSANVTPIQSSLLPSQIHFILVGGIELFYEFNSSVISQVILQTPQFREYEGLTIAPLTIPIIPSQNIIEFVE